MTRVAWDLEDYAAQIDAACGGGWTAARLRETGERICNLERSFNLEAGLTRADDMLPERVLKEAAKGGRGDGQISRLDEMLPEYYALREWIGGGAATPGMLQHLGLGALPLSA